MPGTRNMYTCVCTLNFHISFSDRHMSYNKIYNIQNGKKSKCGDNNISEC